MSLASGTRIGVYEISAQIGAGGMGQVYRATDTKLKRQVAIKILPPGFSADADRLARFQREAELLASLNHPGIAAIYGFEDSQGVSALVMELVEGEDLSQRIAGGAVPAGEALFIARQIADALEAAHERGIIHRDLKPANIKVRPDDSVKVLDFGLAKLAPGTAGSGPADLSQSPTITSPAMTAAGLILGTAAYMSPEQARGKPVDARTDIWAFGCVLFEMFTATRAFPGDDVTETLAAVVKSEPDWARLPADTPVAIQTLLKRCLRKDPRQRLRDAGAVRIELEDAIAAPAPTPTTVPDRPASKLRWSMLAAIGLAIAGISAFAGFRFGRSPAAESRSVEAQLSLPVATGTEVAQGASVAISPDGTQIAYIGARGRIRELYIRPLSGLNARVINDTRGAQSPFFSPDGQWVGFFSESKLKKVSVTGGVVVTLTDTLAGTASAAWSENDSIAFAKREGLFTIAAGGGEAHLVPGTEATAARLRFPQFLPGGDRLIGATNRPEATNTGDVSIVAVTLKTGERKTLVQGSAFARYTPSGHLVFLRDNALWAVPLDLNRLELVGTPRQVLSGIRVPRYTGEAGFDCSATGTCIYVAGAAATARTIAMVDRAGIAQTLSLPPKSYAHPRVSPTGDRIVFWVEAFNCNLEVFNVARGTLVRLNIDGDTHHPTWTPDGKRVTYAARKGPSDYELYSIAADGTGTEERLMPMPQNLTPSVPHSWAPDGTLAFAARNNLWILPPGATEPRVLESSRFEQTAPAFSPDGRWLAYVSGESGQYEVYVRPYPGPGEKYPISTGGGTEPVWSRDGRELFFRNGDQMWSARVSTTPAFNAGRPALLFRGSFAHSGPDRTDYDVMPDGQHFVMLNSGESDRAATEINVILNWFDELKRLAPVN